MKITEISIKRPTLVVVVFTILGLLGFLSYKSLSYELLPKFSPNAITISTIYPGAGPDEVQNTVTKKIEDAVASMENIKKLTSRSMEGVSIVTVELTTNADADYSLQDAQRKINSIMSDLPSDIQTPSLNKFSLDDLPIIKLSATADMPATEFYDLIDQRVAPSISRLQGVAQVNIVGGNEREIQINVDADKLNANHLSLLQVRNIVTAANVDYPTGKLKTTDNQILVRLSGKYADVNTLRNLVVSTSRDGAQVRLKDIADVQDASKDPELLARQDQKSSIILEILKQSDANAVTVSELVHKQLHEVESEYKDQNLDLFVASDSSEFTLESANDVIKDLFIAILLVAIVMLLFLHSARNSLIVMVSIPLSLIVTFAGMYALGFTLNLMSLLALSLVVGILVDDAIVVLENVYRHMEMGKNKVRAALDGVSEIGLTVTSITLVIIVVFLPISFTSGLASNILREFCVTVVIATALSLLVSFTVVPWLSSRFGKLEHLTGKNLFQRFILWFERLIERFTEWVSGLLKWALNHKLVTVLVVIALFISSLMLVGGGFIGGEFIPKGDRGEFIVGIELPKDASLEQTNQMTMKAEAFLIKQPEIQSISTVVGRSSEDGFGATSSNAYKAEVTVKMIPEGQRAVSSSIYAVGLKKDLTNLLTGAKVKTTPVNIMGTADRAAIDLVVMGTSQDSAMKFAKMAMSELQEVDGALAVKLSVEEGNPEVHIKIDRDKMAALGLDMSVVGGTLQTAFAGTADDSRMKFRQGEYEYDMNLRYDNFNRKNINDVANIKFLNNKGQNIKLSQFATITQSSGPSRLERRDKLASVNVQSQVIGRPSGTVVADFTKKLDSLQKPAGVKYVFGGDAENQGDSNSTLGVALLLSIILMYLIMVALYDNYAHPFVVMTSLLTSIIGALLALALTNNTLNIFSIMGIIMLMGLVAKNAIMLVDFANQSKEEGYDTNEALIRANRARLRPILMTTIAMVFGMLPIALASGGVAAIKQGLAWVVIGGLISSMFLTLIFVPVMYKMIDNLMNYFGWGSLAKKRLIEQKIKSNKKETLEVESIH